MNRTWFGVSGEAPRLLIDVDEIALIAVEDDRETIKITLRNNAVPLVFPYSEAMHRNLMRAWGFEVQASWWKQS